MEENKKRPIRPEQEQSQQPGIESEMKPQPKFEGNEIEQKLTGKVTYISGGDSGIGRAIAVLFAKHGSDIAISYFSEHNDAKKTKEEVEKQGVKCLLIDGDLKEESFCKHSIQLTVKTFGRLDVLINNAAVQYPQKDLKNISADQLTETFQTNIFAMFYLTIEALNYLNEGSTIINTTSVTAYRGSAHLIDYASTKGAIVAFTRSLSAALADKKIRVNAVAPGPIWTPLIPASFDKKEVSEFGSNVPLKRAGEPEEVAPSYLFLASNDSTYMTGQILHPNGGEIVNG
ncbi:NAD(P)-dependent oxidoreductase [Solitalea longa]|uniref:NAD(P)-dependent oxidoreductase n=1 Tax=Solitalea longa TaxID=2079460 RepID=A0A2S5A453_9SPHI|nr:SDR family oxidoreductase [Solitalea longa]POY37304.1 NAD(P)-dependent oxidoreductase [Solitalea longa]